jgi:hypothetical protein
MKKIAKTIATYPNGSTDVLGGCGDFDEVGFTI